MKNSILFGLTLSIITLAQSSYGQEGHKNWKASWSACTGRNYLDCAHEMAITHKTAFEQELNQLVQKNDGSLTCRIDELNYELSYDEWFISHFDQIKKIEIDYISQMNDVAQKLEHLKETSVDLTPVEHQTTEEVSVTYENLLSFFKGVNKRMASCSQDQMNTLKAQFENPRLNNPQITLSQFKAAFALMANKLNASLKAQATGYEFVLNTETNPIEFKLKITTTIATASGNSTHEFLVDLLSNDSKSVIDLSEDSKWTYLSKIKIHEKDKDYPLSGFERRDLIQSLLRSHECDRWTSTSKMKDHGDRYPYVTSEGLERMAYAHLPTPPPTPVPATTPTPTPTLAAVAPQSAAASNCKITAENIAGWNAIDASFVCTARYLFRLDEHPQFTKCVIDRLTAGARDGEAIVDTCLSEFRSAGGTLPTDLSCEDQLDRIHSAWPLSDREYICTDRFNIDSKIKSSYTRCVVLVSYSSSDGEVIINQCQAFAH